LLGDDDDRISLITVSTVKNYRQAKKINIHKTAWVISKIRNGAQMEGFMHHDIFYLLGQSHKN
jgi:hypothetical protein